MSFSYKMLIFKKKTNKIFKHISRLFFNIWDVLVSFRLLFYLLNMNMYKVNLLYAYYGKLNISLICFYFHVLFYAAQFYYSGFCFASITLFN